jgi:hypothetical protein
MSKVPSSYFILMIKKHKLEPKVTGLNSGNLNTKFGVKKKRERREENKKNKNKKKNKKKNRQISRSFTGRPRV